MLTVFLLLLAGAVVAVVRVSCVSPVGTVGPSSREQARSLHPTQLDSVATTDPGPRKGVESTRISQRVGPVSVAGALSRASEALPSLVVRTRHSNGEVCDAKVVVHLSNPASEPIRRSASTSNGQAVFRLPAGKASLCAVSPDGSMGRSRVRLDEDSSATIVLYPSSVLEGIIRDERTGLPVQGATVASTLDKQFGARVDCVCSRRVFPDRQFPQ